MPGRSTSSRSGDRLEDRVADLGRTLDLRVRTEVKVGRRIWGRERYIDVVLTDPRTRLSLGIECKAQDTAGTAEEKIPSTIQDIKAWPIRGIVCFAGDGFSREMKSFLLSTGMAVEFEDLEPWLRLYFGLLDGEAGEAGQDA